MTRRTNGILPAVVLAYALVLSAFFGGVSTGLAAGTATDAAFVLCAPSGKAASGAPSDRHGQECPCGLLCQMGGAFLAAAPGVSLQPPTAVAAIALTPPLVALMRIKGTATAEARAPPTVPV